MKNERVVWNDQTGAARACKPLPNPGTNKQRPFDFSVAGAPKLLARVFFPSNLPNIAVFCAPIPNHCLSFIALDYRLLN
jgi:hypothetical protein